jgi:hypothetical protein
MDDTGDDMQDIRQRPPMGKIDLNVLRPPVRQARTSVLAPSPHTPISTTATARIRPSRTFAATHGVAFYDESQAPGYDDGSFWEPSHLNATGARKFSTWLAAVVKLALGMRAAR